MGTEDPKDAAIMQAAFEVFAKYGFRRASMADIAEGAGMSRPALYLRYAGKDEVFRTLATKFFAIAEADGRKVLDAGGPPDRVLEAFFGAMDGRVIEAMLNSPHAAEMIDLKNSVAGEVVAKGEERMATMLADWIGRGQAEGRLAKDPGIGTPDEIAATILAAKFGLKSPGVTLEGYREGCKRLAALFGRALAV